LGCNRRELIGDNQNSRPEKMVDAGQPCEFDTRGPLQRAHIIANWPPIYIGKESDRHSEEGEDLSLLDFKAIEYKRRGNAVADDEQLARIAKVPKREFMRRGINQHTLEKICKQEPVRTSKLTECLKALANGQTIRAVEAAEAAVVVATPALRQEPIRSLSLAHQVR
jgi:hypothetical protein